jgi:hypothetical protein
VEELLSCWSRRERYELAPMLESGDSQAGCGFNRSGVGGWYGCCGGAGGRRLAARGEPEPRPHARLHERVGHPPGDLVGRLPSGAVARDDHVGGDLE